MEGERIRPGGEPTLNILQGVGWQSDRDAQRGHATIRGLRKGVRNEVSRGGL